MQKCSWIGMAGYVFALLFFARGALVILYMAFDAYRIGKDKGWFFQLSKDDIVKKNPFNFLLFSSVVIPLGCYLLICKIAFVIIPKYWICLMR